MSGMCLTDLCRIALQLCRYNVFAELFNCCLCLQQVAGAVLVAACLLNVPPSFLEFLLCLPWRQLEDLSLRYSVQAAPQHGHMQY